MSIKSTICLAVVVLALGLPGLGAWYAFHAGLVSVPPAPPDGGVARDNEVSFMRDEPSADTLEQRFSTRVRPFLERYCFGCHGPKKQKASLDLSRDSSVPAVVNNARRWELVLQRLAA